MNENQAAVLATKIRGTFDGPPVTAWEEELIELDAGKAGTAFARLRREHDARYLTIARFIDAYRSLAGDADDDEQCDDCDGGGWAPAPDLHLHGAIYSQVEPCHCRTGQRIRAAHTERITLR